MKKILSIILIGIMLLGVGCGDNDGKEEKKADNKKSEKVTVDKKSESKGEDNQITVWCWDPSFNIYAMQEAEKIYNEKHADQPIKLNIVETPWPDVQTKITAIGTSGQLEQLPDIFLMQDNAFKKNYQFYPDIFAELTDVGIDFSQFVPSKVAYSMVDNKNYGVPFDNGTAVNALRTDYLEKAGLTEDDFKGITWKQYIELGEKVKNATDKPMMSVISGESDLVMMMLQSCGASLFDEEGNPDIVNNDVLKDIFAVCKEMVDKGILQEVNSWDEYIAGFTGGNVISALNGCWILGSVQTSQDQAGQWAVVDIPKLYAEDSMSTNYSNNGGSSWAVTTGGKNKELAIEFLNETFAGSVEFYNTILPSSGAIATYMSAVDTEAYKQPQAFFKNNQKIYQDIIGFSAKVPSNNTGVYYYEARDAVGAALVKTLKGEDVTEALRVAEEEVIFKMTE